MADELIKIKCSVRNNNLEGNGKIETIDAILQIEHDNPPKIKSILCPYYEDHKCGMYKLTCQYIHDGFQEVKP